MRSAPGLLARDVVVRLRAIARAPTTLALLVVLPPVVVEIYGVGLSGFPLGGTGGLAAETVGRLTGALFGVAFLAGLVGLFQIISARRGDERLALAGYPRGTLLAGRLAAMVTVAVLAAGVSALALARTVDVAAPAIAVATLVGAGLVYGLVGVAIGAVLPRELEGSLLLVFVADFDNVLSSGFLGLDTVLVEFAPLYHYHALFAQAVVDGTLAEAHVLPALGWILGPLVVAVLGYRHAIPGPATPNAAVGGERR